TKARLAFLIQAWGVEHFRATLEERWGGPLERAQKDVRLPGSTDHLGVHSQKQPDLISVGLCVPTGRVTSGSLQELARLAETYGTGQVRLTTSQNAILINVPEAKRSALLAEPLLKELSPDPNPFFRGLVTCTGTDYCNLALIETKSIGKRLAEVMAKKYPGAAPVTMNWSGCPAGCGNHQAAGIGFQGAKARVNGEVVDAVSIFVGGRTGTEPRPGEKIMELVPVDMLEQVVPVILNNLDILKNIRRDVKSEERVLMVPASS
ncbi:MAG: ferredoxin--nitrite reductase, partial [Chloroflexi bacterium]|nr:ferredoxin--nitrite reductase [Chloroflexota bacterium]